MKKLVLILSILSIACSKKKDIQPAYPQPEPIHPTVTDTLTNYNKKTIVSRYTLGGSNSILITFLSNGNADYNINSPFLINTNQFNKYSISHDTLYFNGNVSYTFYFKKDTMKLKFINGVNAGYIRKF